MIGSRERGRGNGMRNHFALPVAAAVAMLCILAAPAAAKMPAATSQRNAFPGSRTAPMIRVGHSLPGFGPLGSGAVVQSGNWAGYDAVGGGFHSVTASWTQPSVLPINTENSNSSFWVGLDGDGSSSVEQCGTEAVDQYGIASYYAWYEMYPAPEVLIPDMAVTPGDAMTGSVTTDGAGNFTLTLTDETTDVTRVFHEFSASAKDYSAEVIAEAPTNATTDTLFPLADFGTVDFSNCSFNGLPIGDAAWRQVDMVDETSSTPLATPSALGADGASFSVACDVTTPPTPVPGWKTQYQGTTGSPYFNGVGFGSASVGAAVGNSMAYGWSGTIYDTADGGGDWGSQYYEDATNTMNGVDFLNASDGWAVGGYAGTSPHGIILATTDGGSDWSTQNTDTTDSLWGISFANASDGWAVGGDGNGGGVVLATTDGGADWSVQYRGSGQYLYGVSFANTKDGWAVGAGGVLATTDGGSTWSQQSSTAATGVAFANASDGWAVGADGVLATADGGSTWSKQSSTAATGVACASAGDVWVVGGPDILASANGGVTWSEQYSYSTYDLTLKAITCLNGSDLWAVGGSPDLGGGTILATTDGGWPSPTLTGFSPGTGIPGNRVVLTGTGFTSATGVKFDGTAATFAVDSDTQITATVPSGAMSGRIIVTTPGGTAASTTSFTVHSVTPPGPTLTKFTPSSGAMGTVVTLTGSGFSKATTVKFAGTPASFPVPGDTSITAIVPPYAKSGTISVTTHYGTATSATRFTVLRTTAKLSLKLGGLRRGDLRLGKSVSMTGKLRPASLGGSRVWFALQRRRNGRWSRVVTLLRTTKGDGVSSSTYKPARRGTYRVKAKIAKTTTNAAASTTWLRFGVR